MELGQPFDYMAFPDYTHSLSEGEGTTLHLYSLLARYLREHLPSGPRAQRRDSGVGRGASGAGLGSSKGP